MTRAHSNSFQQLVPTGKPPLPAYIPARARTKDSLWNVYSPRLARELFLNGKLEYHHWILVESDPRVMWFVEHYPKVKVAVGGRMVTTVFDMLLCRTGNRLALRELKHVADEEPQTGTATWWQLEAQETFAKMIDIPYERLNEITIRKNPLYLENWGEILGYLRDTPPTLLVLQVEQFFARRQRACLQDLFVEFSNQDPELIKLTVFWLLHRGCLQAPLDKERLNLRTEFSRREL